MTIDINTYRARVGRFDLRPKVSLGKPARDVPLKPCLTPQQILFCMILFKMSSINSPITKINPHLKLTGKTQKVIKTLTFLVCMLLIILSGDIELNPGPNPIITHTTKEELSCYFLNARSIKKISDRTHKLREFKELLIITNPDILGVSETWLNNNLEDTDIASKEDYTIHRKDRTNKRGGGVMLMVKANIKSKRRDDLECNTLNHNEIIVTELEPEPGNKLIVITAYRSQQDPHEHFLTNFENTLQNCMSQNLNKLLIMGDFNYSKIKWSQTLDKKLPQHCREFKEVLNGYGLKQLNKNPSRAQNNNILDLVLTNFPDKCSKIYCNIFQYSSDHYLLNFDLNTRVETITSPPRTVYNFKRANFNQLKEDLTATNLNDKIDREEHIDNKLTSWAQSLTDLINRHIPKITLKKQHSAPWIDHVVVKAVRKKNSALKQAKKHDTQHLWTKFHRLRNRLKNLITFKHKEYLSNICDNISNQPKKFWSFIKANSKSRGLPQFLYNTNGEEESDFNSMANIFNNFFQSIFSCNDNIPTPPIISTNDPLLDHISITENEVLKELNKLNPSKAPGPDGLPTRVLKECAPELTPSITNLFNNSLIMGLVPKAWKHANIVPLHKKGNKHQANNYRPISLLPVISKVLERCIFNKIIEILIPKITALQHGFLRNRSTVTQLLQVFSNINNILDKGDQTDVVYFDLSKAFDSVPHKLLLEKLKSFGICGSLHAWITSYLTNRLQRVTLNGASSDWLSVTSGVPQGSILGPLLFILYINDLPNCLSENTLCAIFADDTKIFRQITSHQDLTILQRDINKVSAWSKDWGLTFNQKKCTILSLKRNNKPLEYIYRMDNTQLPRTTDAPDLGITITSNLSWNTHINNICSRAQNRKWFLIRTLGYDAPIRAKLLTYLSLVRSIVEYNTIIWNPITQNNILILENVQRKCTDYILNNPRWPSPHRITYKERLTELKLLPLSYRREFYDLIFFYKSINNKVNFNILDFVSFQNNPNERLTRNRLTGLRLITPRLHLLSSSQFYPARLARLWNSLHIDLRTKLVSASPISEIKQVLNTHFFDRLSNHFDPENTCTFVSACMCPTCRP
jgi:exonuclease III